MPQACSVGASDVAKNAEAYCLVTTTSPSLGRGVAGQSASGLPRSNEASAGTLA